MQLTVAVVPVVKSVLVVRVGGLELLSSCQSRCRRQMAFTADNATADACFVVMGSTYFCIVSSAVIDWIHFLSHNIVYFVC